MSHELTIDREFADLIPQHTDEELSMLRKSLADEGCREPIIVWANHDDTIIDGHTRYQLCTELELPFKVKAMALEDRQAVIRWIATNQLSRRNLTPEQVAYLRGKAFDESKKEQGGGKQNMQTPPQKCQSATVALSAADVAESIAKKGGVSRRTVFNDRDFAKAVDAVGEVDHEAKVAILSGKAGVPRKEIAKAAKEPDKAMTLARLIEERQKKPKEKKDQPLNDDPAKLLKIMETHLGRAMRAMDVANRLSNMKRVHDKLDDHFKHMFDLIKVWRDSL